MADLIHGLRAAQVRDNLDRVRDRIADGGPRSGRRSDPCSGQVPARRRAGGAGGRGDHAGRREPRPGARRQSAARTPACSRGTSSGRFKAARWRRWFPSSATSIRSPPTRRCASWSAHATPETRILVEVNVAGDPGKAGIDPRQLPEFLERSLGGGRRPDDDAAVGRPARGQSTPFRRAARARRAPRPARAVDGNQSGLRACGAGGRHDHPPRNSPLPGVARHNADLAGAGKSAIDANPQTDMAFRDTWHGLLVYFGLAEDEAYEDDLEPYSEPEVQMQDTYRDRPTVRRLSARASRRRGDDWDDIFSDEEQEPERRTTTLRSVRPNGRSGGDVRVHFVAPKNFNDAQDVADKFKESIPVILNLQGADTDLSKRLIDFASGLTLRPRRRHAADRRQGLHADPAQRRGIRRGAGAPDREGLLQPVLIAAASAPGVTLQGRH